MVEIYRKGSGIARERAKVKQKKGGKQDEVFKQISNWFFLSKCAGYF